MASRRDSEWWRHAVVYQIYIRSFADANGDGTGDVAGIRSRLPYLAELGVDALWVNPWYRSPLNDGGYDVADYREIEPRYGTLAEAEGLIADAEALDIRVLIDLVPNHTSSEHAWFQEALAAPPGSAARARYHFVPGRGDDGNEPPNDWRSVFGGPAWARVPDGEWYLHIFDSTQPDLNWSNAAVCTEFEDIIRFWMDRGAAGMRVDVAHALVKDMTYPDIGSADQDLRDALPSTHPFWDRDELHDVIRSWRSILDEYDDRMMVAEAWVEPDRRPLYLRPDEYHQAFEFDLTKAPWDASEFRSIIGASIVDAHAVGSIPTWVLSNHDVVRHATRYGLSIDVQPETWLLDGPHDVLDEAAGARRARAAALLALALPGSMYMYQGEELGLPEVWDLPVDVLDDPIWVSSNKTRKGRDGCRVPMPWEPTGPSLGFGTGEPWLPQPASFAAMAASVQGDDPTSFLNLYRSAISIRSDRLTADDEIEMLDLDPSVVAFRRGGGMRCIVNMGPDPVLLPEGEVLLSSSPVTDGELPGDTAAWLA